MESDDHDAEAAIQVTYVALVLLDTLMILDKLLGEPGVRIPSAAGDITKDVRVLVRATIARAEAAIEGDKKVH